MQSDFTHWFYIFDKADLNKSINALKKVLKLLCWLMWLSSFSLMFPNTWKKPQNDLVNLKKTNSLYADKCLYHNIL